MVWLLFFAVQILRGGEGTEVANQVSAHLPLQLYIDLVQPTFMQIWEQAMTEFHLELNYSQAGEVHMNLVMAQLVDAGNTGP